MREVDLKTLVGIPATVWQPLLAGASLVFSDVNVVTDTVLPEQRSFDIAQSMQYMMQSMHSLMQSQVDSNNRIDAHFDRLIRTIEGNSAPTSTEDSDNVEESRDSKKSVQLGVRNRRRTDTSAISNKTNENNRKPFIPAGPHALVLFDGKKGQWNTFLLQFEEVAEIYNWDLTWKCRKLVKSLRGDTLELYARQPQPVRKSYPLLLERLAQHFGLHETPSACRRQLQTIRQSEQSTEDFLQAVIKLVHEGYPDAEAPTVQLIIMDVFLKGCLDRTAALTAMNRDPKTAYEALELVNQASSNQQLVFPNRHKEMRTVSFNVEADPIPDVTELRAVNVVGSGNPADKRLTVLENGDPWRRTTTKRRNERNKVTHASKSKITFAERSQC